MTVKELIVSVKYKSDDKSIKGAESKMNDFGKKAGKVAAGVGASIASILAVVAAESVKAAGDMEMLTTQFEVMLGSAEKATGMMEQLKQFASTTPFALEDLSKGTQNLLSFGVAEGDVIDTMRMLGDTAGGNAEKLKSLVAAYGKVQVKGKGTLEELNMMAERGIPIYDTLAKQLGVTKEEFMNMQGGVKVSADAIQKAFQTMTSEGGMFYQGMQKQSMTFQGMLSTLKDNITLTLAGIGTKLLPPIKMIMDKLTQLLQGSIGQALDRLITKLVPIIDVLFSIIEEALNNLDPIIDILEVVLDIALDIIKSTMPSLKLVINLLMKDLMPVILDVVKLIAELMPTLLPLISIITQVTLLITKMSLKPLLSSIQSIVRLVTMVTQMINFVLAPVLNMIDNSLVAIGELIDTYITPIFDFFAEKIEWVNEKIMEFLQQFDWFSKIFEKFSIKLGGGGFTDPSELINQQLKYKQNGNTTNTNNVNVTANSTTGNITVNSQGGDPNKIADAVKVAIGSQFNIELKKILVEAGI